MPMPVPRDSALVFFPAIGSRPWGWILLDWIASTARFMTSGLRGVSKTVGSVVLPMGFPWRSKIFAVFLVGIVYHCYFPWVDSMDV